MASAVSNAFTSTLEDIAAAIAEAVAQIVTALGTSWLFFSTPENLEATEKVGPGVVTAETPPDSAAGLETVLGWVTWISLGLCVLSLMVAGAMMAVRTRRGEGGEHLGKVVVIMVATVLIASASAIAGALLEAGPSANASAPVQSVQRHLWWYVGAAVVLSVIVGGAKMAWEQRADAGKALVQSLITLVVVSGCGLAVITLATQAADDFARWLVLDSSDADFGERVLQMLALSRLSGLGVMLIIVLGVIAMIVSLIQMVLILIRDGLLVVLAAILPLAASFTNTEMGRTWFKKTCAWIIAFILYKPAAAIIYAVAFEIVASDEGGLDQTLSRSVMGLALMVMALVALPALIKLTVPMASMGGGGGGAAGAAAGAVAGMAGAVASGAVKKFSSISSESIETSGSSSGGSPNGADPVPHQQGSQGEEPHQETSPDGADPSQTGKRQGTGDTPDGADTGGADTDSAGTGTAAETASGSAGGSAATGNPWLMVAEAVVETGQAAYDTAKGTMTEAVEEPDGSK
ncbi:hypothetical protein [Marinactinospora thermotolerans]|uniref:hypothetical protein n=1 Tax=Marinactinospora thermotolerans TaxID=531310 RepID=UPI00118695C0|nr:hypothetical protein [Marinactinospora thermotolerans]